MEQKINALQGIGQNLDNQRQPLAEVGSLGDKLQTILTDPSSKSEIKGKVGQIERAFNNCRKKLDNALAELENADREGREFAAACAGMFLLYFFELGSWSKMSNKTYFITLVPVFDQRWRCCHNHVF